MRQGVLGFCSVEDCTDQTRCIISKDRRHCKCATGYYSDRCEKDAQIKILCGKNFISIRVLEDFFQYYNVPLESVHLPNRSCGVQREVMDGVTFFMSRTPKEKYLICGGKPLEKNITHISYSLSLLSEPQVKENIIRDPVIKMEYTCVYPYVRTVSLPFAIVPFSTEMVLRVDDLDATIEMMLYTDHTYTTAYSSAPTIELRGKVYVEVTVSEPADFFLLRLDECWATQSPQPNTTDGLHHVLLFNGCVNDDTVVFHNGTPGQSEHNGASPTIRYSFDMFRFLSEEQDLYLHCSVQLCERDDLESCTPNCNSISKREAVRAHPGQGLLSYGPIKIEIPHRPQSSILMTVVLPVAAVWIVVFFLLTIITVAKAGSRRLTRLEQR
ncbi:zona pellucida glycoprotein d [Genypterus blacodes]|uniref:zona pellucida glycoprotein d n=1 Tax=Genypterus blacodes TaxID=154954 RepID=UPI003F770E9E